VAIALRRDGGLRRRGAVHLDRLEVDLAIEDFNVAIRFDPRYAVGYYNRGPAWRPKNDSVRAREDFAIAAKLHPSLKL